MKVKIVEAEWLNFRYIKLTIQKANIKEIGYVVSDIKGSICADDEIIKIIRFKMEKERPQSKFL